VGAPVYVVTHNAVPMVAANGDGRVRVVTVVADATMRGMQMAAGGSPTAVAWRSSAVRR